MELQRSDRILILVFALAIGIATLVHFQGKELQPVHDFGSEYGYIAQSLVEGRGFSGPFGCTEVKTAWMPPLLPVLMAGFYLVFGVKTLASAQALLLFQGLLRVLTLVVLLCIARRYRGSRWLLGGLYAAYLWIDDRTFFHFHDVALVTLASALALLALLHLREERLRLPLAMGLVLPLISPSVLLGYGVMVLLSRVKSRHIVLVLGCCAVTVSLWAARNALSLGGFVPIKSNLWYDFHQANVVDQDGIPTSSLFIWHHPIGVSKDVLNAYRNEGELAFNARHKRMSMHELRRAPLGYLRRVGLRFSNAVVYMRSENDVVGAAERFPWEIHRELAEVEGLIHGGSKSFGWACVDWEQERFERELSPRLRPQEMQRVLAEWKAARKRLEDVNESFAFRLRGLAFALVPTLAILLGLRRRRLRADWGFRFAVGLYVCYLVPYVLVSHYVRYQIALEALMVFLIWRWLSERQERDGT